MLRIVIFFQRNWLVTSLALLATVTILSLWPAMGHPTLLPGTDKTHHFIAHAALVLPLALRRPAHWVLAALLLLLWSGAIELLQPLVNRHGEWADLAANGAGICVGIFIAQVMLWRYPELKQAEA